MITQKLLKMEMLSSLTAVWASPEVFIEKYTEFYNRRPMDVTIVNRRYRHRITWMCN